MHVITVLFLLLGADVPDVCSGSLTRDAVIGCARASSPRVVADRELVARARGDERAARVMLPANPEVGFSAAYRRNDIGDRAANFYGTVSQEIEIAGQRRRRIAAAAAEREAAAERVAVTERDVVADALAAYYDVIAARAELEVLEGSAETAALLQDVARERARAGAGAPIEIDLAEAEKAGLREQAELARGRMEVAQTRLAIFVGLEPGARPEVRGELDPLRVPGARAGPDVIADRPELAEYCFSRRPGKYRCKKRPPECGTPCTSERDSDESKARAATCADALKQCWGDKDHKYSCGGYSSAPLEVRCR